MGDGKWEISRTTLTCPTDILSTEFVFGHTTLTRSRCCRTTLSRSRERGNYAEGEEFLRRCKFWFIE